MYFNFEDYRPDIEPGGSPISRREGVLFSIIVHALFLALVFVWPMMPFAANAAQQRDRQAALQRQLQLQRERQARRFVFVQPRVDLEALKPPPRAEDSDKNRVARAPERAPNPQNPLPFARGDSPERIETQSAERARGRGPTPEPAAGPQANQSAALGSSNPPAMSSQGSMPAAPPRTGNSGKSAEEGGSLGEALRNLQRFVQQGNFGNEQGGGGAFGPSIQFDTKGVEFGPWIRRFVAQIKRNWFVPYAAMSLKGHVALTLYVHKDGTISELAIVGPSSIEAFNNSAYNALAASNPTMPLPPEYPSDRAFFTVTFYYNEYPPATQ